MKSTACRSIVAQWSPDSRHSVPITKSQEIGEQREKHYNLAPSAKKISTDKKNSQILAQRRPIVPRQSPYFGLTDIGYSSVWEIWLFFCEGTLFYWLYWRGQYWVFIVLKTQNESTRFNIRGFILFMHYAWLHCTSINPVSPVLCNVWLSYRRIHWSFLVPSRFFFFSFLRHFSRSFENFSRSYKKYSRLFENYSRSLEKKSRSFEKYIFSFGREIFSFLREKIVVPSRKKSHSFEKHSRLFEKNSRSDEKYSRLFEKNSRLDEKKQQKQQQKKKKKTFFFWGGGSIWPL